MAIEACCMAWRIESIIGLVGLIGFIGVRVRVLLFQPLAIRGGACFAEYDDGLCKKPPLVL